MARKKHRDITDAEIVSKEANMFRWLTNTLRQIKWRQRHWETNKLKSIVLPMFDNLEKQVSLDRMLDNMFIVMDDADFDSKDIETIRQLGNLITNQQENQE